MGCESDVQAWQLQGFELEEQGDWAGAYAAYATALQLDPFACESWLGRGMALEGLGHPEEALDDYDIATSLSLHSYVSVERKGLALHTLGQYQEALECFVTAAHIGAATADKLSWALIYQAMSLTRLERFDDALECCDHALGILPMAEVWITRGNALRGLERFDEALHCYSVATDLSPRYPMALYNRGLVEEDLGRTRAAIRTYRQCLRLGIDDEALEQRVRRQLVKAQKSLR